MALIRICLFVLVASVWVCGGAFAAKSTGSGASSGIASKLQNKYDSIKSMEADFSQTLIHKESGAKETRKGVLSFKKPLLVKWETKAPSEELLVVSQKEIWNVFPDEDVAYKYPLSMVQDTHNILRVITGQSRLEQDFVIENKGKENGLVKLHLTPHEPVQALVEAIFWVDESTSLIQKFRITDFYGNHNDITFSHFQLDKSIKDSIFTYTPAKGIQVEDRTEGEGVMQKPLLQ